MADKYLRNNAGVITELEATVVSTGATEAGDIVALDGAGKLDLSVLPTGVGPDVGVIQASENLTAGNFVNVWSDSGNFRVRKADATTTGKFAHGFVLANVTSGQNATVYFEGTNTQVTSVTPGRLYLDTTAGGWTATAPSTAGNVVQPVGVGTSATTINFEPEAPVVLA
jgi:hypothetical protein